MACEEYEPLLPLYADQGLAPGDDEKLRRHLAVCPACAKIAQEYCHLVSMICTLPRTCPPASFHARLVCQLKESNWFTRLWGHWGVLGLGAATAAALTALLIFPSWLEIALPPMATYKSGPKMTSVSKRATLPADKTGQPANPRLVEQLLPPSLPSFTENRFVQKVSQPMVLPSPNLPSTALRISTDQMTAPAPTLMPLATWSGDDCLIDQPGVELARDPVAIADLLKRAGLSPLEARDWSQLMLGGIFLGAQAGTAARIEVRSIHRLLDRWIVAYHIRRTAEGEPETLTRPYLLFVLPYTDQPVDWLEE